MVTGPPDCGASSSSTLSVTVVKPLAGSATDSVALAKWKRGPSSELMISVASAAAGSSVKATSSSPTRASARLSVAFSVDSRAASSRMSMLTVFWPASPCSQRNTRLAAWSGRSKSPPKPSTAVSLSLPDARFTCSTRSVPPTRSAVMATVPSPSLNSNSVAVNSTVPVTGSSLSSISSVSSLGEPRRPLGVAVIVILKRSASEAAVEVSASSKAVSSCTVSVMVCVVAPPSANVNWPVIEPSAVV